MSYRDIIFLYEGHQIETKKDIIQIFYAGSVLFSLFLFGYSFVVRNSINNVVFNASEVGIVKSVLVMLIVSITVSYALVFIFCKEKYDLYYWRIPGQFFISCSVLIMQYMLFKTFAILYPNQLFGIFLWYLLGLLIICLLIFVSIKKKFYSLDNQKNIAIFFSVGILPGILGLLTSKVNMGAEILQTLFPIYLLSILIFPTIILLIIQLFWIKNFSREEILYARLEKNIKALEASK